MRSAPLDLDALKRAIREDTFAMSDQRVTLVALIAELEATRADLDNERQKVVNLTGELAVVIDHLDDVIARAERAWVFTSPAAEAERDAKETVRTGLERRLSEETARAERAEAAIARVEALLTTNERFSNSYIGHVGVRAALRGDHA